MGEWRLIEAHKKSSNERNVICIWEGEWLDQKGG